MELTHAIVLAILQGLTEFLPISSSGHLILVPALLGWEDQGLAFDIAVHFGSLIAVVSYFRADILAMIKAVARPSDPNAQLAWKIVIATIPLGLAGLIFADFVEANLRSPMVIATTTAVFGIVLWVADRVGRRSGTEYTMGWPIAIGIGLAQVLALIPGTSRSGITMTAALALGLNREAAGRFSFLLSIPAILMASGWQSLNLIGADLVIDWGRLLVATTVSAVVAFVTIALFLKLISRMGMAWFAAYRILLTAVIVYVLA